MIDGTYAIEVGTPLGPKTGTVALRTEGDVVHADIDAPVVGKQHVDAHLEGDVFTAEGRLKLPLMGKVDYTLRGEVAVDVLNIAINSSKGGADLTGRRL